MTLTPKAHYDYHSGFSSFYHGQLSCGFILYTVVTFPYMDLHPWHGQFTHEVRRLNPETVFAYIYSCCHHDHMYMAQKLTEHEKFVCKV